MARSWAHEFFYPKRFLTDHYRFCKLCYNESSELGPEPDENQVADVMAQGWYPSQVWTVGCCENKASPSAMSNHIRDLAKRCSKHAAALPAHVPKTRTEDSKTVFKIDMDLMTDWALNMNLREMLPKRLISNEGVRATLASRLVGLGNRTKLEEVIEMTQDDIDSDVKEICQEAQANGCRFHISLDTWKTKRKFGRRHFCAVVLDWTGIDWKHYSVCNDCVELTAPRNAQKYADTIKNALQRVGLGIVDCVAGLTDHEPAVRKGVRDALLPAVGCFCHGIQLPAKHAMPPLRYQSAQDSSSEGSSSECSSVTVCAEEDLPADASDSKGAKGASKGRKKDPAHTEIQDALKPFFTRHRKTVKVFEKNEDAYNTMVQECSTQKPPVKCIAYRSESKVRWSSSQALLSGVILNNKAVEVTLALHGDSTGCYSKLPKPMDATQLKQAIHIVTVFEPLRRSTRLLEGDGPRILGSMILVVWYQTEAAYQSAYFPVPTELRELAGADRIRGSLLDPLAKKVRDFIRADLVKVRARHVVDTPGETLLYLTTYLDVRFKSHPCLEEAKLQAAKAELSRLALMLSGHYDRVIQHHRAKAALPENQTLRSLGAPKRPEKKTKGKGAGRKGKAAITPSALLEKTLDGAKPQVSEAPTHAAASSSSVPQVSSVSPLTSRKLRPFVRRPLKREDSVDEFLWGKKEAPATDEQAEVVENTVENEIKEEMAKYERVLAHEYDRHMCPLEWWEQNASSYPYIATIAAHVLGMPASTAQLERLYSDCGRSIDKKRPRLSVRSTCKLIHGHCNVMRSVDGSRARKRRKVDIEESTKSALIFD